MFSHNLHINVFLAKKEKETAAGSEGRHFGRSERNPMTNINYD